MSNHCHANPALGCHITEYWKRWRGGIHRIDIIRSTRYTRILCSYDCTW
jgi:hypothetical protein